MGGLLGRVLRGPKLLLGMAAVAATILALVAASTALASPSVVYVRTDGSNSCDGTVNASGSSGACAKATIQAGVDAVAAGGTVNVAAGTYSEQVTVGSPLTLNGAQAGVDARTRSGSESVVGSISVSASGVVVDGFTFNGSASQVSVSGPGTTILSGDVVRNNIFGHYTDVAIPAYDAGNIVIRQNVFNAPAGAAEAMQIKASSVTGGCSASQVVDNRFIGATTNGAADVNFSCTGSASTGVVVSGNRSMDNGGDSVGASFVSLSGVAAFSVTGNTAATVGSTVYVHGAVSGQGTISGNHFAGGHGYAVSIHGGDATDIANTGTIAVTNNDLSNNLLSIRVSSNALGTTGQVVAHGNDLSAGAQNDSTNRIDLSGNWWGATTEPTAVTGATVKPWCRTSDCSVASNDASLVSLSSSAPLSPAFSAGTTSYSANVDNGVTSVSVSGVANTGATVAVSGGTSLSVGSNIVRVTVTSMDGSATRTYTVAVNRAAPAAAVIAPTATPAAAAAPVVNAPASAPATPGASGAVKVAVAAPPAAPGGVAAAPVTIGLAWTPEAFAEPVTVKLTPTVPASLSTVAPGTNPPAAGTPIPVAGGFSLGTTVVQVNVTNDAGTVVRTFDAPLVIHISAGSTADVPAFSQDGTAWTTIPLLATADLPVGQRDGYFVNTDGSVDIYTRHATYFGLLKDTEVPTAASLTGRVSGRTLRLAWSGARDNIRVAGYVVSRNGHGLKATKRTLLVLPLRTGRYRVVALDGAGNKGKQSKTLTVARQKNGHLRVVA